MYDLLLRMLDYVAKKFILPQKRLPVKSIQQCGRLLRGAITV